MLHIARLLDIPGQAGPPSPAYGAGGSYGPRITGRGSRENRTLFCTGRGPGFATPRRESAPANADTAVARLRSRESECPGRLLEKKGNGTKSRDSSSGRSNRSRDGSPRMPRPRSEEIPLELIKRTQNSVEASPKISILPRPQQQQAIKVEVEPVLLSSNGSSTDSETPSSSCTQALQASEETSFIAAQDKRLSRRKGAIETV